MISIYKYNRGINNMIFNVIKYYIIHCTEKYNKLGHCVSRITCTEVGQTCNLVHF